MNLNNRVVYIAGPITGRLDTYKRDFAEAAMFLRGKGVVVLNPAVLPLGLKSHQSYMNICLPMLREAEELVLLPGWRDSKGALMEYEEACRMGMPIAEFTAGGRAAKLDWLPVAANDNTSAPEISIGRPADD